ncbi:MAG: bifunctional glutamate N-acetyltransferase/amino-acid acetyltransferase ArgJ [Oscillospiraceae bacterium]
MSVKFEGFDFIDGGVCAPEGFTASGVHCGLRKNHTKLDLALIYSDVMCNTACVYTTNKVKGAPILVTKRHVADGKAQAIIANSANANTCNIDGEEKAEKMCSLIANELNLKKSDIVVASTGVIGQILPIEPIANGVANLKKSLSKTGNNDAATAILTTDTVKKEYAISFKIGDKVCKMGATAKGSGMIHPNMATMFCFITTDVAIDSALIQMALNSVVKDTLNMVSVDGDTSTNDMVTILASGKAKNPEIQNPKSEEYEIFVNALYAIMMNISREIAADGEGATKLLECTVCGAKKVECAKIVAKSVITSSLFKSAMFGEDANWGRILCAMGYAQTDFDINLVDVWFKSSNGEAQMCKNGFGVEFDENYLKKILSAKEIKIIINLNDGDEKAVAWGCDLTYDYVKINGDYRS